MIDSKMIVLSRFGGLTLVSACGGVRVISKVGLGFTLGRLQLGSPWGHCMWGGQSHQDSSKVCYIRWHP